MHPRYASFLRYAEMNPSETSEINKYPRSGSARISARLPLSWGIFRELYTFFNTVDYAPRSARASMHYTDHHHFIIDIVIDDRAWFVHLAHLSLLGRTPVYTPRCTLTVNSQLCQRWFPHRKQHCTSDNLPTRTTRFSNPLQAPCVY